MSPLFFRKKAAGLLDLGLLDDFLEVLLNLLVRERILDHGLLRFEGRIELCGALGFKLHDMKAELRADRRLTDFAGLEGGEGSAEGRPGPCCSCLRRIPAQACRSRRPC